MENWKTKSLTFDHILYWSVKFQSKMQFNPTISVFFWVRNSIHLYVYSYSNCRSHSVSDRSLCLSGSKTIDPRPEPFHSTNCFVDILDHFCFVDFCNISWAMGWLAYLAKSVACIFFCNDIYYLSDKNFHYNFYVAGWHHSIVSICFWIACNKIFRFKRSERNVSCFQTKFLGENRIHC